MIFLKVDFETMLHVCKNMFTIIKNAIILSSGNEIFVGDFQDTAKISEVFLLFFDPFLHYSFYPSTENNTWVSHPLHSIIILLNPSVLLLFYAVSHNSLFLSHHIILYCLVAPC